jgi:putative membrane protein insertion efficiency factor
VKRVVRRGAVAAAIVAAALWLDARRPPPQQLATRAALGGVAIYQRIGSPMLASMGVRCRFVPTCSRYAEAVLRKDGFVVGTFRAAGRVVRCGPWTPMGTEDQP